MFFAGFHHVPLVAPPAPPVFAPPVDEAPPLLEPATPAPPLAPPVLVVPPDPDVVAPPFDAPPGAWVAPPFDVAEPPVPSPPLLWPPLFDELPPEAGADTASPAAPPEEKTLLPPALEQAPRVNARTSSVDRDIALSA